MIDSDGLLDRALKSAGLRIRGEADTLLRLRRRLIYERTKDPRFAPIILKLKPDSLEIHNSSAALQPLEEIFR